MGAELFARLALEAASRSISLSSLELERSGRPRSLRCVPPDIDLLGLIKLKKAKGLVNERHYWGVPDGEDHLVLVEEADRSRRLLRDCECRSRGRTAWGYGGTGPSNLASVLLADALGPLSYCPSCLGMIAVSGGLISYTLRKDGNRVGFGSWKGLQVG